MSLKNLKKITKKINDSPPTSDLPLDHNVVLVDGLNMFIRSYISCNDENENGEHVGGLFGFLRSLGYTVRMFNPTKVVVVFDGKGGTSKRRKIDKNYKQGRTFNSKLNRINKRTDEEEDRSRRWQVRRLINYLMCLPIQVLIVDGLEADDIIGYLVTESFIPNDDNKKVTIVSEDKDFLQLTFHNKVQVYRPIKRKLYNYKHTKEEFGGILPENLVIARSFLGDKSDNIPKIRGLGEKTLIKLFPELTTVPNYSFEAILEKIKNIPEKKRRKSEKRILENVDRLRTNYKLMTLKKLNLSGVREAQLIDMSRKVPTEFQPKQFKQYMEEDYYQEGIPYVNSWLKDNWTKLSYIRRNTLGDK